VTLLRRAGYANWGLSCYRGPHSYDKYWCSYFYPGNCNCGGNAGYVDMGCSCLRNPHSLGTEYMTCRSADYFVSQMSGRCHRRCPSGYENTGATCFRLSHDLGMDYMTCKPTEHMLPFAGGKRCYPSGGESPYCPTGQEGDELSCAPKCKAGYKWSTANICEQQCPSSYVSCGLACAKDAETCGMVTFNQVIAPCTPSSLSIHFHSFVFKSDRAHPAVLWCSPCSS
jgi:hypothetical protein